MKEKKYEEAKKNLTSLKVMEDKSKKQKADTKNYPTYKTYEASLNAWKHKLVKQIEDALALAAVPAPETEKEPAFEPEETEESAEEIQDPEVVEPEQSEKPAEVNPAPEVAEPQQSEETAEESPAEEASETTVTE